MSHAIWPACDGETADLIRRHDWSATALGPHDGWPLALRMHVDVMLRSPIGMALVWGDERVLIYNDAYAVIAGAKHPQVFGGTLRDAWPEAWEFNRAVFDAGFSGEQRVFRDAHFQLARPGQPPDAWFDLSYWPAVDERQQIRGVLCTVIETTARVCAEQLRDRQERRLQQANQALDALRIALEKTNRKLVSDTDFLNTLFRQAPSFMAVLIGPDHVFELANDAYLRLVQQRAIIGKPVRAALPEVVGQGFLSLLDRVYASGEPFQGRSVDVQLERGDGQGFERRVVDFLYQPLKDEHGAIYGIFVEGVDITDHALTEQNLRAAQATLRELNDALERKVALEETERFKAEEALRQAHKMEAVGQLASGVAHDFNNVLQIISSNLQLMELDGVSHTLAGRLANAVAAVERGSKLSSQLLAFARRQPLQPVPTNLGRLVADIKPLLLRALGDRIEIGIEQPANLWNVEVDRNQLENAILNMAINARDAMAGAGRLGIALDNVEADGGSQVCLAISDTGCGMPPEVLAKIFDPFYTTKAPGKGTGLGMSMVYGFVKQSGGEIRIDSAIGAGSTIRIYLPRAHAEAAAAGPRDQASEMGAGETILVVDDDCAVVASTIEILASLGYRTLSAADGRQAADILATGVAVDLLFSDLSMPGTLDCAALVAHCRAVAPHTAILLTSGHVPDAALTGGIELLPKPYTRVQLARALRQQLGGSATAAPVEQDGGCRILVVEDDPDTRELACELLAALGHEAGGSASAEQALLLLRERKVDILFTDLNLPGLSGIELATRAIAAQPSLKVILASGEGKHVQLPPGGAITLLPKPYDLVQLQLSIDQTTAMQH